MLSLITMISIAVTSVFASTSSSPESPDEQPKIAFKFVLQGEHNEAEIAGKTADLHYCFK